MFTFVIQPDLFIFYLSLIIILYCVIAHSIAKDKLYCWLSGQDSQTPMYIICPHVIHIYMSPVCIYPPMSSFAREPNYAPPTVPAPAPATAIPQSPYARPICYAHWGYLFCDVGVRLSPSLTLVVQDRRDVRMADAHTQRFGRLPPCRQPLLPNGQS